MKKLLMIVLTLTSAQSSFAGCKEHFEEVLNERKATAGRIAGMGAVTLAGTMLAGPAFYMFWPLPAGVFGVSGSYFLISTSHPRKLVQLMEGAQFCTGKKIKRFYNKYARHTQNPMSLESFCGVIHEADFNGSLCSAEKTLPSKASILDVLNLD